MYLLIGESISGTVWSAVTQTVDLGSWTTPVRVTLGAMVVLGAAVMDNFMAQAAVTSRRSLKTFIVKLCVVDISVKGMNRFMGCQNAA